MGLCRRFKGWRCAYQGFACNISLRIRSSFFTSLYKYKLLSFNVYLKGVVLSEIRKWMESAESLHKVAINPRQIVKMVECFLNGL